MKLDDCVFFMKQKVLLGLVLSFTYTSWAVEFVPSSDRSAEYKVLEEFTVTRSGNLILLPVRFKEKEYLFLLETGASITMFDISFRDKLGDAKRVAIMETAGNPMMVKLFDAPEAFLGSLNLQDCGEVTCVDLEMLTLIDGRKISGVIGMSFLKKYTVQIDFDEGILLFIQPTKFQNSAWGEGLAINYNSLGCPYILGDIRGGIKVNFLIDTGANITGNLESKIFRDLLKDRQVKTYEGIAQTASGAVREMSMRTSVLSIGSSKYQGLIFDESNESRLELRFLSRHIVTFDFPNSKIYFKKGKEFKKVDEEDMSGLHLLRKSNKTVVYSVDEDSPAQKAGIKANDVILKVQNEDASTYDMWDLRRVLISRDERKIRMAIKRGNDVKELSFLLKKKI